MIEELVAFMKENSPNYISTVEGDVPHVRPMGFIMEYQGKLTFATSAGNGTSAQLAANPNIEVATTAKTRDKALRIWGKAVVIADLEEKIAIVADQPGLQKFPGPEAITIFSIDKPQATWWSYTGVEKIDL